MRRWLTVSLFVLFLSPAAVIVAVAQTPPTDVRLPFDAKVRVGRLDNGLRYYVRPNARPENRAELRLVVNVGSVLEDDDQLGLAHFAEHMAFNGTRRFPKQELVDYLEKVGMRFGAHLNASTSFDETIYQLLVPTDTLEVLRTGFEILEDWAHGVAFEPEEIDKERGVVLEEWRLGRGAQARMQDQQLPIIFRGSRYADRLPIGTPEVLRTFEHATLRRFYETWYRPDLMAVIAVGDFDPDQIEALIREHFSNIPGSSAPAPRPVFDVPGNRETLFAIATDPEETGSTVALYYKQPVAPTRTEADYRREIVEQLYSGMLNARLFEIGQQPDAPFLYAFSGQGSFVRPLDVYMLAAAVKEGEIDRGLEALLTEAERVAQFGFTASELDRQKQRVLRSMETRHAEREKTESRAYTGRYVYAFLLDQPVAGIEYEYELYRRFVPEIELDEVNRLVRQWLTQDNRVVVVNAPEREPAVVPGEDQLLAVLDARAGQEITPYEDTVSDAPLVGVLPEPAAVVQESYHESINVTDWTLANGTRVLLKPTDFKDDEIVFWAWSPGGHSLAPDDDYVAAMTATEIVAASGLGSFSLIDLQKALSGKRAFVFPEIYDVGEGLGGDASPKDVETLFDLIYLHFTAPRVDSSAYVAYRQRIQEFLRNRDASPEIALQDTLTAILTQSHFRARPFTNELLEEMDIDRSLEFYRDRFADASDFTFVFVGNFNVDSLRPLVERYVGGLPSISRVETWRDVGIRPPTGVVRREVRKGLEPKSETRIVFTGPFEQSRENRNNLRSMGRVLNLWLRESLREDLGGTYGAGVNASSQRIPTSKYQVFISFGSAPDRVDELVTEVFAQIDSLARHGPSDDDLVKIREAYRRDRETSMKQNRYWVRQLVERTRLDMPLDGMLSDDELIEGLTAQDIMDAARRYLRTDNYIVVTLFPEQSVP